VIQLPNKVTFNHFCFFRNASDKDFKLTVLSDCCADGDEEVHHILTVKVFQMQADDIPLKLWISQS
jgi:nicotinamidase-related amidase